MNDKETPTPSAADLMAQADKLRAQLEAERDSLDNEIVELRQRKRNVDAELAALPRAPIKRASKGKAKP